MFLHDWVIGTKASDIMVRKLVVAQPGQSLNEVTRVMMREQISGLPVVDEQGICCGVFSMSDIPRAEQEIAKQQQQVVASEFFRSDLALPESVYVEKLEELSDKMVSAGEQPVENYMTTNLVCVAEDATLENIVRSLVDAHLHRVLVVGEDKRLKGIVATTDILAALLRDSHFAEKSGEIRHLIKEQHL